MAATNNNGEPSPFSLNDDCIGGFGVASDSFSFWDQTSDDLSAKGNGGMRQLYNYVTIDSNLRIDAPKEDYAPDKIGSVSLENLQQQRNNEIQISMEKQVKVNEHPSHQQMLQQHQQKQQLQAQYTQQQQFQQQLQMMGGGGGGGGGGSGGVSGFNNQMRQQPQQPQQPQPSQNTKQVRFN
jgi:hypothetical protein